MEFGYRIAQIHCEALTRAEIDFAFGSLRIDHCSCANIIYQALFFTNDGFPFGLSSLNYRLVSTAYSPKPDFCQLR